MATRNNTSDILDEFEEFLKFKKTKAALGDKPKEEYIEIWDEKGRGCRVPMRRVRPEVLESLGIEIHEPEEDETEHEIEDETGDETSARHVHGPQHQHGRES